MASPDYMTPEVTYVVHERAWTLTECFWCRIDKRTVLRIPAGFSFDLSSIPRLFWGLLAPNELGIAPPLVHDRLYRDHTVDGRTFKRREVDNLFRLLMDREGVWWWRRWAAWLAVRGFGWLAWRRKSSAGPTECATV